MIHPARLVEYDALVDGLNAEVAAGNVATTSHGPLTLYKYTQQCTFDKGWTPWSIMARGLIVNRERRELVATPFPKFFNYGERQDALPDEPFEVSEKVDGSLAIIFHDGCRWRVTTRGSFTSEQAAWAESWLYDHVDRAALEIGTTYLAEIVYAANRIVIRYAFEGLVLLGAYATNGHEFTRQELLDVGLMAGLDVVPATSCAGLDDLLAVAKTLSGEHEGFVVRFASGLRIKIKGDEYCRIHRLVSHVTPLAVWEMIAAGDELGAVAKELPEEFRQDFETIQGVLIARLDILLDAVRVATANTVGRDDKSLGLWLSTQAEYPPDVARWIFPARKKNLMQAVHVPGNIMRRRLCETFRPTGNQLEGYQPSNAMNRFASEIA